MFLQSNNRNSQRRSRTLVYVCVVLVLVVVGLQVLMPHFLPGIFTSIAVPYWRTKFSIESGSLMSPSALLAENETLKRQIETYEADAISSQALLDENAEIRALLGREISSTTSAGPTGSIGSSGAADSSGRLLSAVLSRPPLAPYDELIIDVGSRAGVAKGDRVYAAENSLIGQVEDVLADTSKVILYTSPGQHMEVMIGTTHAPAQATGRGGGQYSAELPSIVRVSKGDLVIAPSLGEKPVAVVRGVMNDPASAFETVLFAPLVDIYTIRFVTVKLHGAEIIR